MKPLAIDLFCGLGGWAEGFLAEGYEVIGFDIERHDYGTGGYPGHLVIQDVLTLHGSQFRDAALIVASPPCQEYSYMAMPWKRVKKKAAWYMEDPARQRELTALFDACFRIQSEAIMATGRECLRCSRGYIDGMMSAPKCAYCDSKGMIYRDIPLIVENVRGAQPWVGRAQWNYGSYYLWGDVPALMPKAFNAHKVPAFRFDGTGRSFQSASVKRAGIERPFNPPWVAARAGKNDSARKAASAQIAKIPFPLAQHIARCYLPACKELSA